MSGQNRDEKRHHMRFKPEDVEIALIQFTDADPEVATFEPHTAGLVIDEAYGGCGLVALGHGTPEGVHDGARCNVKVGKIGPVKAEVRWVRKLDEDVSKLGIEYLNSD